MVAGKQKLRRPGFRFVIIVTIALTTNSCPTKQPGTVRGVIQVDGHNRTYLVHLPSSYTANVRLPLVVALHRFTENGRRMERLTGFDAIADREKFIVAYPDGNQRVWNANPDAPSSIVGKPADDIAFIEQLIDHLIVKYNIDPDRVYVTGASSGGLMTHRVAAELTDTFAAAASVMITLPKAFPEYLTPSRPLPFLMIQGKADPFFPWEGGVVDEGPSRSHEYLSVADTLDYWVENNGASTDSLKEDIPDIDSTDGTTVFREEFPAGTANAEVILYGIRGGGHTWPGSDDIFPQFVVGKTCNDVNASEIIWEFFSRHTRQ